MTPSRYEALLRDLTAICRKVFDATPISEAWHDAAIMSALRQAGSNVEGSVIRGCLENLRKSGLVIEPNPRHFQRVHKPIRIIPMPTPLPENTATTHRPAAAPVATNMPSKSAEPARKLSTLDRLSRISLEFRALADELDDIAIQADEDMKAQGQDSETLRQLQKLLGNIGSRA